MPFKMIVLTGAPRPSLLRWDDPELLDNSRSCFSSSLQPRSASEMTSSVQWRLLCPPLNMSDTASSDENHVVDGTRHFPMGAMLARGGPRLSVDTDDEKLSEFYDHSF